MSSSDITPPRLRADSKKKRRDAGPAGADRETQSDSSPRDSTVISYYEEATTSGRLATVETRASDELSFARRALHGIPPMRQERTSQLIDRIRTGYYNRPDILAQVAERLGERFSEKDDL